MMVSPLYGGRGLLMKHREDPSKRQRLFCNERGTIRDTILLLRQGERTEPKAQVLALPGPEDGGRMGQVREGEMCLQLALVLR